MNSNLGLRSLPLSRARSPALALEWINGWGPLSLSPTSTRGKRPIQNKVAPAAPRGSLLGKNTRKDEEKMEEEEEESFGGNTYTPSPSPSFRPPRCGVASINGHWRWRRPH